MKKSSIIYSENESKILGFKIGRYDCDEIDIILLEEEISQFNYEIIRVKTSVNDEYASLKLSQLGLPFYYNGSIRRYEVNCKEAPLPDFTSNQINFVSYNESDAEELYSLLLDSWGDHPIGYYRLPGLSEKITKEKEIQCVYEYYKNYFISESNQNNRLWLMKYKDQTIGFFALTILNDMVDSTIAGIYKKFQNQGLFPNILRKIRAFCRENDLTYFVCGARNENIYSQRAFENDYMKYYKGENVYCILNTKK